MKTIGRIAKKFGIDIYVICILFLVLIRKCYNAETLTKKVNMVNIIPAVYQHLSFIIVSMLAC